MACHYGHESIVLVLLQNKADSNIQTKVTSRRVMMSMIDIMSKNDKDNYENIWDASMYVCIISFHHLID